MVVCSAVWCSSLKIHLCVQRSFFLSIEIHTRGIWFCGRFMGDFAGTDKLPIIICLFFFLLPSTDKMVSSDQLSFRHNIFACLFLKVSEQSLWSIFNVLKEWIPSNCLTRFFRVSTPVSWTFIFNRTASLGLNFKKKLKQFFLILKRKFIGLI